jgi:hypothetical protein
MTRNFKLVVCLIAALCTQAAHAQTISPRPNADLQDSSAASLASNAPVAYVYVSSNSTGNAYEVHAFAASANGRLTRVTGSPFQADVTAMAVNGKYLFGSNQNGMYVDSFSIEADGALRAAASNNIVKFNESECGFSGPLFLDHTGATLYDMEIDGNSCANNAYQSFSVSKTSGSLHNLGSGAADQWLYLPASFIGNNVYAYSASCLDDMYWQIFGFKRSSSGLLSQISINAPTPTPKEGDFYCPSQAAADRTNHVAITFQAVDQQTFGPDGPPRLATYTSGASGNLSTHSTRENMPQTSVVTVTDINMSPSGKLLAVTGTGGLQIFHFNGSSPITHYTGLLTRDEVDQVFWDNANHLYAISQRAGKLFVFTVTPTGFHEAPGSPYKVVRPQNISVQPRS